MVVEGDGMSDVMSSIGMEAVIGIYHLVSVCDNRTFDKYW